MVSGSMIRALGCSHVIVRRIEGRKYFGETNERVLGKTAAAIDAGLTRPSALESVKRRTRKAPNLPSVSNEFRELREIQRDRERVMVGSGH